VVKKLFFDFFGSAKPNAAHLALAKMEQEGSLQEIITQYIDNLHQEAGSKNVYEFHGNSRQFICMDLRCSISKKLKRFLILEF
jgi:NAD-dependent deacetylase